MGPISGNFRGPFFVQGTREISAVYLELSLTQETSSTKKHNHKLLNTRLSKRKEKPLNNKCLRKIDVVELTFGDTELL